MYRVLFAEDELLVRMGLQNSIPWEKYNMELTAQADNGITAYELFLKIRPEVVITDIRMDGMDGYELIRKIRDIDQNCAIIIISCLDDFESLRKMMGYRISGYLLKVSMTMEEIFTVLQKVQRDLEQTIGTNSTQPPSKSSLTESLQLLFLNRTEPDWFQLQWEDGRIFLPNEIRGILLFCLKEEDTNKTNDLGMKFVYNLVQKFLVKPVVVPLSGQSFCVITLQEESVVKDSLEKIQLSIDNYLGVSFLVTAGFVNKDFPCLKNGDLYNQYISLSERQNRGEPAKNYKENLIMKAISYMQIHYRENLSLDDIANITGISPSYFSYLFKRESGKNYVEYLNEIRMEHVLEELKSSDMKLMVIAERNGFRNLEYFSRYFKKQMGVSPAKWRISNQNEMEKNRLEN